MKQESLDGKRLIRPIKLGNMVIGELGEGSVSGMADGGSQDSVEW